MADKGCYFFIAKTRETAVDCHSFRERTGFRKSEGRFELWPARQNYLQQASARAAAAEEAL
jgi:hypothetical protein